MDEAIQQYLDLAGIYYSLAELDMARKTYQSALRLAQHSTDPHHWTWELLNRIADIDMQRTWDVKVPSGCLSKCAPWTQTTPCRAPVDCHQPAAFARRCGNWRTGCLYCPAAWGKNAGKNDVPRQSVYQGNWWQRSPKRTDIRKRPADLFVRNGERLKRESRIGYAGGCAVEYRGITWAQSPWCRQLSL